MVNGLYLYRALHTQSSTHSHTYYLKSNTIFVWGTTHYIQYICMCVCDFVNPQLIKRTRSRSPVPQGDAMHRQKHPYSQMLASLWRIFVGLFLAFLTILLSPSLWFSLSPTQTESIHAHSYVVLWTVFTLPMLAGVILAFTKVAMWEDRLSVDHGQPRALSLIGSAMEEA